MQKQCANPKCGQPFDTDFSQKEYCSLRCRHSAKEQRVSERDKARMTQTVAPQGVALIKNPTIAQLAALGLVYAAKANSIPTLLTGALPEGWTPPQGVELVRQIGTEEETWLLQTKEGLTVEEMLAKV